MLDLKNGNISDSTFIQKIIETAQKHAKTETLSIALKPADVADVLATIKDMIAECKMAGLLDYSLDTLDEKERVAFNTNSMQALLNQFNHASGKDLSP